MAEARAVEGSRAIDGSRRCILCGREAEWRPVLLVVPNRAYTGKPLRQQVGVAVCGPCRKPLPDELLGVVNQITDAAGAPRVWDVIVRTVSLRGAKPHFSSTRVEYVPLDGDEARGHDAAAGRPLRMSSAPPPDFDDAETKPGEEESQ